MDYVVDICRLSHSFYEAYPPDRYPEIMHKYGRPYTCLLIEACDDYFICIPFRSSVQHDDAFIFENTRRSMHTRSGLDYKKAVLIKNLRYIDTVGPVIIDDDEYTVMMNNIRNIANKIDKYIKTYVNHISGIKKLHQREFLRHYRFSTLPYFHDILGIIK